MKCSLGAQSAKQMKVHQLWLQQVGGPEPHFPTAPTPAPEQSLGAPQSTTKKPSPHSPPFSTVAQHLPRPTHRENHQTRWRGGRAAPVYSKETHQIFTQWFSLNDRTMGDIFLTFYLSLFSKFSPVSPHSYIV